MCMFVSVPMSKEILDTILAVRAHKTFIIRNNHVKPKADFDWYEENKRYFFDLELPKGLRACEADYDMIYYGLSEEILDKWRNTPYEELSKETFRTDWKEEKTA